MRRNFLWFAFALSLLFNVFFAVGYARARSEARARTPVARVAEALDLDERQTQVFASLRRGIGDDDSVLRPAIALAQQELIAELDREQPDPERVRAIVARQSDLIEQQRLSGFDHMCDFVRVLKPEQRRRMFRHFDREGGFGAKRREEMMRRFDKNGDGTLDEAEKAELRAAIDAHHREREQHREEMRKRFDTNGDGELDESERAALQRSRRRGPDRP